MPKRAVPDPWTSAERRALSRLRSPGDVQRLLETIPYSTEPIYRSPRAVLRDRRAHCFDGAMLAAAALERLGHRPLLVDLRAWRDDDHVLAVYRLNGAWGAVGEVELRRPARAGPRLPDPARARDVVLRELLQPRALPLPALGLAPGQSPPLREARLAHRQSRDGDHRRRARRVAARLPRDPGYDAGAGPHRGGTRIGVGFLKSDRFVPTGSVPYGIVFAFTEDTAGNVWMSHQEGLFHLFRERVVERIPWTRLGRGQPASALLHDAAHGGLWLGFRDGGAAYFQDGQLRASYSAVEGLGEGMVRGFYIDKNGKLWVPTEGGLSRIKDGHILTLTTQNGLPCNTVHWMMEDDAQSVWLYLSWWLGAYWPVGTGRLGLPSKAQTIQVAVFDSSDEVSNHRFTGGYSPLVAKSADRKLWFVQSGGVSLIDPHHLPFNTLPPPVHIEQITADNKPYDARMACAYQRVSGI